jgi:hypothetical protein
MEDLNYARPSVHTTNRTHYQPTGQPTTSHQPNLPGHRAKQARPAAVLVSIIMKPDRKSI